MMLDLNKEREAFEGKFPKPHWIEWDEELGQYTSKHVSDVGYQARFEVWLEAKAQAVPEGYKLVPVELSENIAERIAFERVPKPRPENDPVWVEIAERAYKSNLLAKKWELVREYKILTEASESGAEG
ncbi:hypothetical protein LJD46_001466 [Acinetobacter baumannii]|uniref:hypothetical protein n=1 Tax=Acinetobacter baumannii TaxID=470 RepID=UPI000D6479E2|nr:hypothetical protein [Acinetobacter baumannii]EKV0973132.1 hypothetical protein [Acinetobacter baumannii]EKV2255642.1 hypothetical protein [Acinetobacter baumannii]